MTTMGTEGSSSSSKAPRSLGYYMMPSDLTWGNRKFLRCMKVNDDGQISAVKRTPTSSHFVSGKYTATGCLADGSNELIGKQTEMGGGGGGGGVGGYSEMIRTQTEKGGHRRSDNHHMYDSDRKREMGVSFKPPQPPEKTLKVMHSGGGEDDGDDGNGIAAFREKVIHDLRTAGDKMKDAILRKGDDGGESPAVGEVVRPWNLRTRRAASKLDGGRNGGTAGGGEKNLGITKPSTSPLRVPGETTPRMMSSTRLAAAASPSTEKKERAKFSIPLTRQEIEADFMAMAGHRPHRRPKKRAKNVQRTIETLLPGAWLTEITADMYKVPENQ